MTAPPPRGPDGAAPEPPDWLSRRRLPQVTVAAGTVLHRVHRSVHAPVFFSSGPGEAPTNRFDSAAGRFGVLYAAPTRDAALIETLLRNPARLMVDYSEIASRAASELVAARDLRLVAAVGRNLSRMGTTAALATGPYGPCGLWADALEAHPEAPDGILYASRHNPDARCIALFERAYYGLTARPQGKLTDMLAVVAAVLDAHGKSIAGAP